jgi:hypothetical protein
MPDLSAVTNNYFTKSDETFADNLSSSILALAATVPVNSTAPYVDGDQCVITVEPGTVRQATFTGTVSGNSFVDCIWTEGDLSIGHTSGRTVTDYDSATHFAMLTKGVQQEHDPDGTHGDITPTSISVANQTWASLVTGWLEADETWTYASATTFTISGDKTAKYAAGVKLRLVQSSTTKYFYVISSSFAASTTTVTVNTSTDYTLANAAISAPYYSYNEMPLSFPARFAYTPTFGNLSGGTLTYANYTIKHKRVTVKMSYTLGGAGVAGGVTMTTPTTLNTNYSASNRINGSVSLVDTGTATYFGVVGWSSSTVVEFSVMNAAGTYITATALSSTVPHTWASTDKIFTEFTYEMI